MRVGLVIYGGLEILTGGYLYDRFLVAHLRKRGHHVVLFSLARRPYLGALADNLRATLLTDIRRARLDVLMVDALVHPSVLRICAQLHRRPRPVIVALVHQVLSTQRRPGWQNRCYGLIEGRFLKKMDGFVFNSPWTRKTVEQWVGACRPAVVATPGGDRLGCLPGPRPIAIRARAPGPLRLLFVGNVTPNKGLISLVTALAVLPREIWRLDVVGDPAMDQRYTRQVRRLIARCGLSQQVALRGVLDGEPLARLFAASHVLTMPFSKEGFGIAYLEAMAHGLVVIGSSDGALPSLVVHGQNGFLVDPASPLGLNSHLQVLHGNRALLTRLGTAALATFGRYPTWAQSMQGIHDYLQYVCRRW